MNEPTKQERKGGGRNAPLFVLVTPEERIRINMAAAKEGTTYAEVVRVALFAWADKVLGPDE